MLIGSMLKQKTTGWKQMCLFELCTWGERKRGIDFHPTLSSIDNITLKIKKIEGKENEYVPGP